MIGGHKPEVTDLNLKLYGLSLKYYYRQSIFIAKFVSLIFLLAFSQDISTLPLVWSLHHMFLQVLTKNNDFRTKIM